MDSTNGSGGAVDGTAVRNRLHRHPVRCRSRVAPICQRAGPNGGLIGCVVAAVLCSGRRVACTVLDRAAGTAASTGAVHR